MLVELLIDYLRHETLRARFSKHPASVLEEYQIAETDRHWLRRGDFDQIENRLREDVSSLVGKIKALLHDQPIMDWYGYFNPVLNKIGPATGTVGTTISFTIAGQLINSNAWVIFSTPGEDDVAATGVSVAPSGKQISGTAVFLIPGQYDVVVVNGDPALRGVLAKGFKAIV